MTALRTSGDRLADAIREKLEVLTGERGSGADRAVRVKDMTGLNNALAGVNKRAGSIATQLNRTRQSLSDILTQIGNLVDQSATDITDLQDRVTAAEQDITTLKQDVATIKSKLAAARAVAVPAGTATNAAGAAPTAAEFANVVADLNGLRTALSQVVASF